MKYMQSGGFQAQPLMRLTLLFTLLFLVVFWTTNFALYFAKMDVRPASVQDYYLGSETAYTMPKTYQAMLEVTHGHLPMMALVILLLTHLLIFAPYSFKSKIAFISASFSFALFNELSGWLVRFAHPGFAWLKVISFLSFQALLGFLLFGLTAFLLKKNSSQQKPKSRCNGHADVEHTIQAGQKSQPLG